MKNRKQTSCVYSYVNIGGEVCYTDSHGRLTAIPVSSSDVELYITNGLPEEESLHGAQRRIFYRAPEWSYLCTFSGPSPEAFVHVFLSDYP